MLKFKNIIRSKMSFKESAFGWDGLTTFVFSNVVLLVTLGLGFSWLFWRTLKIAMLTKTDVFNTQTILVAGLCLVNNQPADEFKTRLNRVVSLSKQGKFQVVILGGMTGNNQVSEARAGADYLITQGGDATQIIIEEQSRHTLENMQNARKLLLNSALDMHVETSVKPSESPDYPAIITSRYHLYRVVTLAQGLKMTLQPIAAEDHFSLSVVNLLHILKEAYYLHWYWSGKLWVFITVNKKSQARIT